MRKLILLISLGVLAGCGVEPEEQHVCEHDPTEVEFETYEQAVIDCTERQDTGYVRGEAYPITVVNVDGKPVETNTANAFWVMQQAAAADGVNIRINSGFRTNAQQTYLYNCYLNGNCNNGNLAARPGYSNHQSGLALDLNTSSSGVLNWLNNNGSRYGFRRTVPSEAWHWEWKGGVPENGICGIEFTGCDKVIAPEGGRVDNSSKCFKPYGPAQYWRTADGGVNGSMRWTNAFKAGSPSNWARWFLNVGEAGRYRVEFSRQVDQYFVYDSARYRVRANGNEEVVYIDQSAGDEDWQVIGEFEFAAGQDQWVSLYDNSDIDVPADQHIGADAIRLVPVVPEPEMPVVDPEPVDQNNMTPDTPDPVDDVDVDPSNDPSSFGDPSISPGGDDEMTRISARNGGCNVGGALPTAWGLLLLLFGFRRRR